MNEPDHSRIKRPIVFGVCPNCAGQGMLDGDADCPKCGGTGDLDLYRLTAAYDCGRDDALRDVLTHLAELRTMIALVIDAAQNPIPSVLYRQLRGRIGG